MHDDETAERIAPLALIKLAWGDAIVMWQRAWFPIIMYACLQSAGLAAGYMLLLYVLPSTTRGAMPLAAFGAFACSVLGGFAGAPLARYATLTLVTPPAADERIFDLLQHYADARGVYRSMVAIFAALCSVILGILFVVIAIAAILIMVGGIWGQLVVAIAACIIVPLFGMVILPIAHFLWASACLRPGNPLLLLLRVRELANIVAIRGDSLLWGAIMVTASASALSLLLVLFSATALIGNVVVSAIVGTAVVALFMSGQWVLAMRFYNELATRHGRALQLMTLHYTR